MDGSIDHVATVFNVNIFSVPERGDTYTAGESIKIDVRFTEALTVTGTPQLELTIETVTRTAEFTRLWDSRTGFSLEYKVQSEDLDRDGLSIAAGALSLNGGSIQDSTGNDADLDLGEHAISNAANHKVDGSINYAPMIIGVWVWSEPERDDTYTLGEVIQVGVRFSEPIAVTGTPQLTLTIGNDARSAELAWVWESRLGLVFEYEVQAEDLDRDGLSIAADALSLAGGSIKDGAGSDADLDLGEHAISNAANRKVDGSINYAPMTTGVWVWSEPERGDTYALGEVILVGIGFTKPIAVTGSPQLTLTIGNHARSAGFRGVWKSHLGLVFGYEVQAEDLDRDGVSIAADALKLNGASIQDSAGSDADLDLSEYAISNASDHKVDGSIDHVPTVSEVFFWSVPRNAQAYAVGEVIRIRIRFNEMISVTGMPQLTLTIGSTSRTAQFTDEGLGWVAFEYEVQAEDLDRDGISIAADALSLNGGTIRDSGGNDADLDLGLHAISNAADHQVDGSIDHTALITGVWVWSEPERGDTYGVGEEIRISTAFSERITVTGAPQLELTIGNETRIADLEWVWDSRVGMSFKYEVRAEDLDRDGISIAADALMLNGGTIQDSTGNAADLGLGEHAISNASDHKVDGSIDYAPAVEDVVIWTQPQVGDTYAVGELIEISVDFTETVTVTGTPELTLTVGSDTRNAEIRFWSLERGRLRFHYVVQAGDLDRDGISIAADALSLNGATIRDSGGNDAELDLGAHAIGNAPDHKVDGSIDHTALITGVWVWSEPEQGDTYAVGEEIEIGIGFSETIAVTGTPQLTLTIGNDARSAELHWVSDSRLRMSFEYEVQAEDLDRDGISIAADALSLNGGSIKDSTGNAADRDLGEHAISNAADHKVDGSIDYVPTVSDVYIWSEPHNRDAYGAGEVIGIGIEFSEAITLTGTPQLTLTIGDGARRAEFINWSSRSGIVWFEYDVQPADLDRDGVSIAADALSLNGATIEDGAGNAAELDLGEHAISNDGDHRVDGSVDHVPVVREVEFESHPERGDTYAAGEAIEIEIEFNEVITVTGSPELTLTIGNLTRSAQLVRAWRRWVSFEYEVQADDLDGDGISIAVDALSLNGATIKDSTGNDAELDLGEHAISNAGDHKVDGSIDYAPTVTYASLVSRPVVGDTYAVSEEIVVHVRLSEPVTVTGTPQLTLTIGSTTRTADLASVWPEHLPERLFFAYRVQADDLDRDGIGIAADALSLNGATIVDRGGNGLELGLGEHAISSDSDHKVDGSIDHAPRVRGLAIWSEPRSGDTYGRDEVIEVIIGVTEPITVTGTPQLTLTIGSAARSAGFTRVWDTQRTASFEYVVQAEDLDSDGISIAADALSLNGATIQDGTGNDFDLDLGEYAISNAGDHKVDGTLQVVELGCKQPDALGARVVAGRSQEVLAPGEELVLELEENRDGSDTAVVLGCVALEGEYRYSISAGNEHGAFRIGASDGMLSYVGGGEDAEATSQHLLTVSATPQGGGGTIAVGVRIAIANVNDPGVVVLSTMGPALGEVLTAQLEDQDAGVLVQRWQWRRKAADGAWTAIEGATTASYTPVAADVGNSLQARVAYTDEHGTQQAASEQTAAVDLAADRRARMLQLGLTGFGRSVASGAVSVIGERFAAAASSVGDAHRMDAEVTVNRRSLRLPDSGDVAAQGALLRGVTEALGVRVAADGEIHFDPVSGAQLLSGSAFSMEHGSGGRWGVWASGDVSGFASEVDGFEQEATVVSGYLGMDYRFVPNGLAGLAASYSSLDLTSESELEGEATLTGHLINAYPYGFWMPEPWFGLWGVAGLGTGRAELEDLGATREGELRMWLGAMGQRVELVSAGGLSLAAKSDGFITGLTSFGELPRVDADAWRVRLLLEGGLDWRPGDSRLAANVELGGRLDGGDAERGLGAEGGAALSYTHIGSGLGITGRVRLLLVHEDEAIRDWGASAILSWAPPGPASGLALSLAPTWGEPTSGVDTLWRNREVVLADGSAGASSGERGAWLPDAVDLKVSYGLGLLHGRVTPFAAIQFEDAAARRLRIGAAVETSEPAAAAQLQLEAFGERAATADAATHRLGVGGTIQY